MRKVLIGVVVAALFVLAVPVPAQAAAPAVRPVLDQATLLADGTAETTFLYGVVRDVGSGPHRVDFTIDTSAIDGFATFRYDPNSVVVISGFDDQDPCRTSGSVLTCRRTGVPVVARDIVFLGTFTVAAKPGASAGDSGRVVVTASIDGGPVATTRGLVQVGRPVDIAGVGKSNVWAAPGGVTTVRPQVRNVGTASVRGVVLAFYLDREFFQGTFRNCRYSENVACTFDTVLRPGRTYQVSAPMRLRPPGGLAAGSRTDGIGMWMTTSGAADWGWTGGRPGTGGVLRLVEVAGAAAVPQKDVDRTNDVVPITLTLAGTRPDVAAVGATLAGAPGETVTAEVGLVNHGPGTLQPNLFLNNSFGVDVVLPANVDVKRVDDRCLSTGEEGRWYRCWARQLEVKPDHPVLFSFTVKIRAGFHGGGRVDVAALSDEQLEYGRDRKNNTAEIKVAAAGLPITGPGLALDLGLLLLAAGAAAILLARGLPSRKPSHRA